MPTVALSTPTRATSTARAATSPPGSTARSSAASPGEPLSDVAPVLTADLEERLGHLLQRADPRCVHEHREDVLPAHRCGLEPLQRGRGLVAVRLLELLDPG